MTVPSSGAFRVVSTLALVLGVLTLALCVVLAVASYRDTESSTAAIGYVVAIVLAVPTLVAVVLTLAGMAVRRRSAGAGLGLVVSGLVVVGGLDVLILAQLLRGS